MFGSDERTVWEKVEPKCKFDEIELNAELRDAVKDILEDRNFDHALTDEGLRPRKLIMLHGPPGCGKTSIAHALAAETKLPLYLVSGAQLESKYVGEAEKNAERVFKFAAETECVLLIDEFDSFGTDRQRSCSFERKLTNTLLVNMEMRPPKGITVACSNFLDMLDPAIMRRFDLVLEVPPLSRAMMIKIAENIIKGRYGVSAEECVNEGLTPSGVVRAAKNRLRSAIIAAERINPRPKPAPKPAIKNHVAEIATTYTAFDWGGGMTTASQIEKRMLEIDSMAWTAPPKSKGPEKHKSHKFTIRDLGGV